MSFLDPEYKKSKPPPKKILPSGNTLKTLVRKTVKKITDQVAVTLGPNGLPVMIERGEPGLPPIITKDGVTVIKSLSFYNEAEQMILEYFRDAAIRTVETAGDGTTSATILANAILKNMDSYLEKNTKLSHQASARILNKYFETECLPYILNSSLKVNHENSSDLLYKVANISTNGDSELSKAVIDAFNLVGDGGHVTISEEAGIPELVVSKADGLPFDKGYESSLGMFSNEFINDQGNNRIFLDNPRIILVDGKILDLNALGPLLQELDNAYAKKEISPNVILMAHSFQKDVVAKLAQFFKMSSLKILPCQTPIDMNANSQHEFLMDVAAFTGGTIFNSLTNPLYNAKLADIGQEVTGFEMSRHRSIILGMGKEDSILKRTRELKSQMVGATKLGKNILEERIGRLTGGIAKITIKGVNEASNREIRDRADDAICAIRGAIKSGVLPGGCRILLNLSLKALENDLEIVREVMAPSLREPLLVLLTNCGLNELETEEIIINLINNPGVVYDALKGSFGKPVEMGILDSTPAVLESLRSAINISSLLSTLGGIVAFARDDNFDLQESLQYNATKRDLNQADEENSATYIETGD